MRVAAIINPKAGHVSPEAIETKIRTALFRCELDFHSEPNAQGLAAFVEDQVQMEVDFFVVVGGDGTMNLMANIAMSLRKKGLEFPPICIVSSGTANDLAYELGIDIRIDRAVQAIFSGKTNSVDLLKVTANGQASYMFTNGGIGLTAHTAKAVNLIKDKIRRATASQNILASMGSGLAENLIHVLGPNIYNLMLVTKWFSWKSDWEVEITADDDYRLKTKSPFILVNNQRTLARRFHTAPATANNDGRFNILVLNQDRGWEQVKNVIKIGRGRWVSSKCLVSKEISSLKIKTLSPENHLIFIGDGEVLQEGVSEIEVTCVHPGIKVISDRGVHS